MATLNFPDAPDTGDIYTDSNSGFTYEWNGTVWISKDPSTASNIREIDDISSDFDGSDTTFTLKVAGVNVEPANVQQLIISVGGVMQNAGDDYTVSGSTLTFTTAPTSGLTFFGTLLGTALSLNTVADGSVGSSSLKTEDYTIGGSGNTVTIPGNLTVQGTETIINTNELNVQDKTIGIGSTNAPTSASQDGAGAIIYGQTHIDILYDVDKAALGISTAVSVSGFVTATRAQVGTGVTINNTGIDVGNAGIVTAGTITAPADLIISAPNAAIRPRTDQFTVKNAANSETLFYADANSAFAAYYNNTKRFITADGGVVITGVCTADGLVGSGVTINNTGIDAGIGAGIITAKTYFGDATNMTGAGSTFQALAFDPFKSKRLTAAQLSDNIALTFNHGIEAGNADKEVTLRKTSPTGDIVQSFGVGSSVTYSAGQAVINPTDAFQNEEEYYVVVPEGAFKKIGTASSSPLINTYSFLTANFVRKTFSVGRNNYGQLMRNVAPGDGVDQRSSPVQVGSTPTFDYAAINKQYGYKGIILGKDPDTGGNTAWSIGYLQQGQSGTNVQDIQYSSPTQIGTDTNWRSTAFGDAQIIATKTNGTLWAWGYGDNGSLGQNEPNIKRSSPVQIGTDTTWSDQIGAYSFACLAIKTNGTLWSWGSQQSMGLLGHNEESGGYSSPKQVGTDTTWSKMCKGGSQGDNVFAIKTNGTLWTWGWQYNTGSMGLNEGGVTRYSSPTQVGTSTNWHGISVSNQDNQAITMGLKTDGTLWSWGNGSEGKLGLGNETNRSSPTQIGTDTTWGNGIYDGITNGGDYTFTVGGESSGCIKTDGTLWTWGENDFGSLGHNSRTKQSSPKQVGSSTNWGGLAMGGYVSNECTSYFFEKSSG
jgi:alpha-tubulin suppressor-like RCC1 family protein